MHTMRRAPFLAAALALGAGAGALIGGCGSSTKTVSDTSPPPSQAATQPTSSSSTAKPKVSTQANGGTVAQGSTRSAPEPAFTRSQAPAEGASAATALVRAKGFTPNDTSQYRSNQTLRVLVGTRTGSGDGYGQQAFFFLNGRYLGTDAKQPSAKLRVASQSDTEVTLAYPLYRKNDPLCCPGGGTASVRFQLNNGRLTALDPIPPAQSSSGTSRQ
jgi:hypothetical protein